MVWPLPSSNQITLQFGGIDDVFQATHTGIDIQGNEGEDVVSALNGEVVYAGYQLDYGYVVYLNSIYDGKHLQTRYAHLQDIRVELGDNITSGSIVGQVGRTGRTNNQAHLHFEILESINGNECAIDGSNTVNRDPLLYLNPVGNSDISYMSGIFAIGETPRDTFALADSDIIVADVTDDNTAYMFNKDLSTGEAYLRKLVEKFAWEKARIKKSDIESKKILIWNSSSNTVTINLNYKTRVYGISIGNAVSKHNRLVVNSQDFYNYFYTNEYIPSFGGVVLSRAMSGVVNNDVRLLQERLNSLNYKGRDGNYLDADGRFGGNTEYAVNTYKNNNGLANSGKYYGKVNKQTWDSIFSNYKVTPEKAPVTPPVAGAWQIPATPNINGTGQLDKVVAQMVSKINAKITSSSATNYYNAAVAENCLPAKYSNMTSAESIQLITQDLLWNQNKINRVWEESANMSTQYGVIIDPRLLLSVIMQEGTGSFDTNFSPRSPRDGGGYIQPDFEKDLRLAFNGHILGKIWAYTHYAAQFQEVSDIERSCATTYSVSYVKKDGTIGYETLKYSGTGDMFEYVNNDVPRIKIRDDVYTVGYGVYAAHYQWCNGIRSYYERLSYKGAAIDYSVYIKDHSITWPAGVAKPNVEFIMTNTGTDSKGDHSGYPMIRYRSLN